MLMMLVPLLLVKRRYHHLVSLKQNRLLNCFCMKGQTVFPYVPIACYLFLSVHRLCLNSYLCTWLLSSYVCFFRASGTITCLFFLLYPPPPGTVPKHKEFSKCQNWIVANVFLIVFPFHLSYLHFCIFLFYFLVSFVLLLGNAYLLWVKKHHCVRNILDFFLLLLTSKNSPNKSKHSALF